MIEGKPVPWIAVRMIERAESSSFGYAYFDEHIDSPRDVPEDEAKRLVDKLYEVGHRHYPEKRIYVHRSGSDPHAPIDTGIDKKIAVSVG